MNYTLPESRTLEAASGQASDSISRASAGVANREARDESVKWL